jgi:prevent-host-death family protein
MFVEDNPNHRGNVAELKIAAAAAALGVPVMKPLTEHERYDLVFEVGGRLLRVQCKCASRTGDVVVVRLVTNRRGPNGFIRGRYTSDEIDAVAAYCPELDECYLLTMEDIDDKTCVHLRLGATRNGQSLGLHFAADHLLSGAIAQLGERLTGSQEVGGSSPPGSTSSLSLAPSLDTAWLRETAGMQEFHARIGHYVRHVQAGNSVLVTRWGRPVARLVPAAQQQELPGGEIEVAQPS